MVNDEIDEVPSGRNSLGVTVNACDIRRWVTEHENSRQFKIKTHRQRDKKAGMEGDRSRDGRKEGGKGETIQCNTEPKSRSRDTSAHIRCQAQKCRPTLRKTMGIDRYI